LDLSRYDRLASRFQHEQVEAASFLKSGIETRNPGFNSLIDQIEQVSINSRAPILLMGPTGAGKSHLARRIFDLKKSRRQVGGPFVEVNCATLRGDGAMSALFGHKRGAFTGALQDRPGLLLSANGGMVFLDEIGELGPDEQAMLLHAVEEKCFLPVGSDKEIKSDFQLIAGTNRDLSQAIRRGEFREDLLARLNLWTFRLPGLNERPEDIEPNLDYELDRFTRENGRRVTFNKEARNRFLKFATSSDAPWTANFRDLGAAVTRMATLASSGRIDAPLVDSEIERLSLSWGKSQSGHRDRQDWQELLPPELLSVAGNGPSQAIDKFDQVQLLEVLRQCRRARTISEAGRLLFGTSRTEKTKANDADRLRKYLARFELDWRLLREFWDNRPM
jgi:transcriptional regulatory protein RtcR